mmetsp:Transcript_18617/g.40287  ORF Transcript_18617/g.40287 Transcript_18617/m.40287 type:complete len:342 (+) Transcript_18617:210-1235(+)
MATSLDALEALLQFREGTSTRSLSPIRSHSIAPVLPVPNPLDPTQPHFIEGDAPTPVVNRQAFGSDTMSVFSPKHACVPVVTTVPDPLATPIAEYLVLQPAPIFAVKSLTTLSVENKLISHGFSMNPVPSPIASSDAMLEVEVTSDKIRDALHSKPQRGKKRLNLNEYEREELTRTRNREHAKSTRSKKKARLQELLDVEKKYLLLQERNALDLRRRQRLVEFVENSHEVKDCPHSSRLNELACQEMQKPEFVVTDTMALTAEKSGLLKVSAHGTDLVSGNPKSLSGVIRADFTQGTADITAISLYWSAPERTPSSRVLCPSVSVLSFGSSFESQDCSSPR